MKKTNCLPDHSSIFRAGVVSVQAQTDKYKDIIKPEGIKTANIWCLFPWHCRYGLI